ncbi:MAG: AAA family ATPase, partial [Trebonia sp.]
RRQPLAYSRAAGSSCLIRGVMPQSQRFDSQSGEPFPCPSAAGPVVTQDPRAATLVLMVGLPAAGKTTRAGELAATHQALRLTPDHWMIPLFGDPVAGGRRWALEGRLISVALQALRVGTSVVLDFGLWGRDERSALRWLARSAGAACQVVYLPVDKGAQLARIARRQATAPQQTFPMSEDDVGQWREQFRARRRRARRRRNPRSASGVAGLAGMGGRPLALMHRQLT